MKIAVLSDIHANRAALEAVLQHSVDQEALQYWFLGDAVGYGPEPVASLMFLKRYAGDWVLGNHDAMLADLLLPEECEVGSRQTAYLKLVTKAGYRVCARGHFLNDDDWRATKTSAIQAVELNRAVLADHAESDGFWREMFTSDRVPPRTHHHDGVDHLLVHSGQVSPLFRYVYGWQHEIFLPDEFRRLQAQVDERGCPRVQWFGHTHVPTLVQAGPASQNGRFGIRTIRVEPGATYALESELCLVNPGSVGQPRDLDQRAAYAVLDTVERSVTFHRVDYDWRETAQIMIDAGYPDALVKQLQTAPARSETPGEWREHFERARRLG